MHSVFVVRLIVWYLYTDRTNADGGIERKRSIYSIEITITHIIAFTITINYPNIVKVYGVLGIY